MSLVLFDAPGPRGRRRARIGGVIGLLVFAGIVAVVIWRLFDTDAIDADKWEPFRDTRIIRRLAEGLGATIRAAALAIVLALVLGVVLAAGRLSRNRLVRWPCAIFVEFFRSIPVVLLILFLYIGFASELGPIGNDLQDAAPEWLSDLLGLGQFTELAALVLALGLYNGAVLAEIFRAGILAVPKGQREAAMAAGMTDRQVMRVVLLPQAARIMLPAIVSQTVVALKDTALGFIIAYQEFVRTGRLIYDSRFNIIATAIIITVVYVSLNMAIERFAIWLERRQARRYSREAIAETARVVEAG